MKISLRTKELRKEKHLTQLQLAKDLGLNQVQISRWENRVYDPKFEDLIRLALYFDVTVDYLLGLTDNKTGYLLHKK